MHSNFKVTSQSRPRSNPRVCSPYLSDVSPARYGDWRWRFALYLGRLDSPLSRLPLRRSRMSAAVGSSREIRGDHDRWKLQMRRNQIRDRKSYCLNTLPLFGMPQDDGCFVRNFRTRALGPVQAAERRRPYQSRIRVDSGSRAQLLQPMRFSRAEIRRGDRHGERSRRSFGRRPSRAPLDACFHILEGSLGRSRRPPSKIREVGSRICPARPRVIPIPRAARIDFTTLVE
jgi:hypothetical protein